MFLRLLKSSGAIVVALGLVTAASMPAHAEDQYVPPGGIVWTDSATGGIVVPEGGDAVFAIGENTFTPGEDVDYYLTGEQASQATLASLTLAIIETSYLGSRPANPNGGAGGIVNMPAGGAGNYTLAATQGSKTVTAQVIVYASAGTDADPNASPSSGGLSMTGVNSNVLQMSIWASSGLIVFGTAMLILLNKRRLRSR